VDATLQPGDGGLETRIDYRMDRGELLFERSGGAYRGAYEIRVIFYRAKGGEQVTGDAFQRTLRVANYSDTRLRGADVIGHVTLRAPSGKYKIQVVVTDLVAERASGTEIRFEVPEDSDQFVWFTDLSLGTSRDSIGQGAPSSDEFTPVPSRRFGLNLPDLAVRGELVDHRPAAAGGAVERYRMGMRVLNDLQETVWRGDTTIARTGDRTPFLIRLRLRPLEAGGYRLLFDLASPSITPPGKKKPVPVRRERDFRVDQTSENVAWESRSSLDVLKYIANQGEIDEIERLDGPEARKAFWERFWKVRDPTPDTGPNEELEEFYRRVEYANQHFGVGVAGWRTDMGATYIRLGAPDEVVSNPFNFDRPPEQIWYYYKLRRAYVFVDRDGFGKYELESARNQ
jgi:GWxTD domain-containing protein